MIDFIGFILGAAFLIWLGNNVLNHLAEQTEKERRRELDWELRLHEEARDQRLKEQALECEYGTIIGELNRIEKGELD
jgi:hypothetical protein